MYTDSRVIAAVAALLALVSVLFLVPQHASTPQTDTQDQSADIQTFTSADAFRSYAATAGDRSSARKQETIAYAAGGGDETAAPTASTDRTVETGERTTVQVAGVDEPDFVKTDGTALFYSGDRWRNAFNTTVISDLPDMTLAANLSARGKLLLHNDTLIVVGDDTVTAYDVGGDTATQRWTKDLKHGVKTARIMGGDLMLVLSSRINSDSPCPIRPMGGPGIPCTSIYHPGYDVQADATYSIMKLDAATGDVAGKTAFIGSPRAEVYATGDAVYMAYTRSKPRSDVMMDFLRNHASIDSKTRERLRTVDGYTLSEQARSAEINHVMERWQRNNPDKAKAVQRELRQYVEERKRSLETTTIVRIGSDMQPGPEATIPGRVTNRLHMHAFGDKLAVLSQIDPHGFQANTTNDLTLLDASLTEDRTVKDIANGWIRYARFTGNDLFLTQDDQLKQYDLTTGNVAARFDTAPEYIHAIGDGRALAIGQVERDIDELKERYTGSDVAHPRIFIRNLTVSLLNTTAGTVADRAVLDQPWSRASHDIHAFQTDPATSRFFLPASDRPYVGSYTGGLSMQTVNASDASRAFFIGDHLYTIGDRTIKAFDSNQQAVSRLMLPEHERRHKVRSVPEPMER